MNVRRERERERGRRWRVGGCNSSPSSTSSSSSQKRRRPFGKVGGSGGNNNSFAQLESAGHKSCQRRGTRHFSSRWPRPPARSLGRKLERKLKLNSAGVRVAPPSRLLLAAAQLAGSGQRARDWPPGIRSPGRPVVTYLRRPTFHSVERSICRPAAVASSVAAAADPALRAAASVARPAGGHLLGGGARSTAL